MSLWSRLFGPPFVWPERTCVNCGQRFRPYPPRTEGAKEHKWLVCFYCQKPLCSVGCGVEHIAGATWTPMPPPSELHAIELRLDPQKAPCCGHETCPKWSDFTHSTIPDSLGSAR